MIPFGKAKVVRQGRDLTVVTCGALVKRSMDAARVAEERHGISTEVIDLRSLSPLDMETIGDSVRRTNKVMGRVRGRAVVGDRVRGRRAHRRRTVPVAGRARAQGRGAGHMGGVLAPAGKGDPSADGRRAGGNSGPGGVLSAGAGGMPADPAHAQNRTFTSGTFQASPLRPSVRTAGSRHGIGSGVDSDSAPPVQLISAPGAGPGDEAS